MTGFRFANLRHRSPDGRPGAFVCDDLSDFDLLRALAEVSPERREKALSFRFEPDRRLSVAAYLLLKEALLQEYGLDGNPRLAYGPNGKPFLPEHPEIHFNLSHCPNAAVCAVADGPVGIDVEVIAPVDETVARRVLSNAEFLSVKASEEQDVAFARYWTQKEALVKLTGDGIDDSRLPALLADTRGVKLETTVNRERGYVLTLASGALRHVDDLGLARAHCFWYNTNIGLTGEGNGHFQGI